MFRIVLGMLLILGTTFAQVKYSGQISVRWIKGGLVAEPGQFKYMASLQIGGIHQCGASIIESRWLLTAAHCVKGVIPYLLQSAVGSRAVFHKAGTKYGTQRIVLHPNYNETRMTNDLALVQTTSGIEFNSYVQPIRIYRYSVGGNVPVVVSGWTRTLLFGALPNIMEYTKLRTLTVTECESQWKERVGPDDICVVATSTGTCLGDLGNPLVYNGQQIGVAAFVEGHCQFNKPAVYTRLIKHLDWINFYIKQ